MWVQHRVEDVSQHACPLTPARSIMFTLCTLIHMLSSMHCCTQSLQRYLELIGLPCQVLQRVAHVLPPRMQITDAGLRHLAPHFRLTHLDLSYCLQLTDDGLDHIRGEHLLSVRMFTCYEACKILLSWAASLSTPYTVRPVSPGNCIAALASIQQAAGAFPA